MYIYKYMLLNVTHRSSLLFASILTGCSFLSGVVRRYPKQRRPAGHPVEELPSSWVPLLTPWKAAMGGSSKLSSLSPSLLSVFLHQDSKQGLLSPSYLVGFQILRRLRCFGSLPASTVAACTVQLFLAKIGRDKAGTKSNIGACFASFVVSSLFVPRTNTNVGLCWFYVFKPILMFSRFRK